jgi:predicted regulator of Ras-like GTPase activity (Roadblock/LC7/MglB family)
MQPILTALKDIPGVVGSFVLTPQGALVAREMPAIYPDSVFPEIGRRLRSVSEAIDGQVPDFNDLLLKFESYWLLVRRSTQGFLSILTTDTVNYPALKMATNVALKQVNESMATAVPLAIASPPPEAAQEQAPQPAAASSASPATKPRRFWRGQAMD